MRPCPNSNQPTRPGNRPAFSFLPPPLPSPLPLCYNPAMRHEHLFTTIATELPTICRQLESPDAAVRAAGLHRLRDFVQMLEPARSQRRVSRRRFMGRAAATFAALSIPRDD